MSIFDDEKMIFNVVVNHEGQYSLWPEHRLNPAGWDNTGKKGPKAECLAYIEKNWADMRPRSIQNQLISGK